MPALTRRVLFVCSVILAVFSAWSVFVDRTALFHLHRWALSGQEFSNEIRIVKSMQGEGIGAVLSNLKPLLYLAHEFNAVVTGKDMSAHGYNMKKYVAVGSRLKPRWSRYPCKVPMRIISHILMNISKECERYDFKAMQDKHGIFKHCNTLLVDKVDVIHPRTCLAKTAPFVRKMSKLKASTMVPIANKTDVCILRRGGDIEERVLNGTGNVWAIDLKYTLPVLAGIRRRKKRGNIIVSTETEYEDDVRKLYRPDVLSNKEKLPTVVKRLSNCRCLFIGGGTSFASALVAIVEPRYIVYMVNAPDFQFHADGYNYEEFGEMAMPIRSNRFEIVRRCSVT